MKYCLTKTILWFNEGLIHITLGMLQLYMDTESDDFKISGEERIINLTEEVMNEKGVEYLPVWNSKVVPVQVRHRGLIKLFLISPQQSVTEEIIRCEKGLRKEHCQR